MRWEFECDWHRWALACVTHWYPRPDGPEVFLLIGPFMGRLWIRG